MIRPALAALILAATGSSGWAAPICTSVYGAAPCGGGEGRVPGDATSGMGFRSFDGSGNNVSNRDWGAVGSAFRTRAGAGSGEEAARGEMGAPRDVSDAMGQGGSPAQRDGLSSMFWAWGQFLDHDVTLTPESHEAGKMSLGGSMGDVDRSVRRDGQQLNEATAWIDASMVYGTSAEQAESLRANDGSGRLRMSGGDLLPTDADGNFLAGDPRVNEQQQLISMHTVFAREHNRVADTLAEANPGWDGERLYQESRALVGGQIQAITYNDWLPKLLGDEGVGDWQGYDAGIDASLTDEFSACAFRFCHSMIPDELERLAEDGDPIAQGHLRLRDGFFAPDEFREAGGTDPLLRGLAAQQALEVDRMFTEELRSFLDAGDGEDGDLLARNLARGRDHGLADYGVMRAAYGLDAPEAWGDVTDDPVLAAELKALYGAEAAGMDPYLGALMEKPVSGGIVGELNAAIIGDQFTRLRDGDRFWYENVFEGDVLAWLDSRTLADVIRDNTGIGWLQDDVFVAAARGIASEPAPLALIALAGLLATRRRRRV